MPEIVLG